MIKPFITVNTAEDARTYAECIINYKYPKEKNDFKFHVPVGDSYGARNVNAEIMEHLAESQFSEKFHISSTYGPDGPTATDKELVITLTRK